MKTSRVLAYRRNRCAVSYVATWSHDPRLRRL